MGEDHWCVSLIRVVNRQINDRYRVFKLVKEVGVIAIVNQKLITRITLTMHTLDAFP